MLDPELHQALAHGGLGLIEHPEEGMLLLLRDHGAGEFQIAAGVEIELHVLILGVELDGVDTLEACFLCILEIRHQHAERDDQLIRVGDLIDILFAELLFDYSGAVEQSAAALVGMGHRGFRELFFDEQVEHLVLRELAGDQQLPGVV